jgi:methylenetetrahydrofolate dehydrogenase (NADP+)/methenyltetrahydrofolate cyclohydrolase
VTGVAATGRARVLEGAPIARAIRGEVATRVAAFAAHHGYTPTLAVVVCGSDAPSMVYLRQILAGCEKVGIQGRLIEVSDGTEPSEEDAAASRSAAGAASAGADAGRRLVAEIRRLNLEREVAGIIVQMPLPPGVPLRPVIEAINPVKDIDGIHPVNAGLVRLGFEGFVPATAHAVIEILKASGIQIEGRDTVVIGRSPVVGLPVAFLFVRESATVTVCHRRTVDLAGHVARADIVVVAAGHPGLVTGSMLKPGAVVVDVGINVVAGRIVGDVDFASAVGVASAITPVPGGLGPLTNALLLAHLVEAADRQARGADRAGGAFPSDEESPPMGPPPAGAP